QHLHVNGGSVGINAVIGAGHIANNFAGYESAVAVVIIHAHAFGASGDKAGAVFGVYAVLKTNPGRCAAGINHTKHNATAAIGLGLQRWINAHHIILGFVVLREKGGGSSKKKGEGR